jgi:high-affinity iron transporter
MIGEAIQELQEQAILTVTNDGVPAFVYTLGLNPSWEAIAPQAAIAALALGWGAWSSLRPSPDVARPV